jgi:segregation and condensation protein B
MNSGWRRVIDRERMRQPNFGREQALSLGDSCHSGCRRTGFARLWLSLPRTRRSGPAVGGPLARDERLARLEAALFLAGEPLAGRKLAQLAGLSDGTEARTLVRRLNQLYDQGSGAFRVEELAGGFQLLTRPTFGPWLKRLLQIPVETRLSPPAMETLAVIAYRQPVQRSEVEAIRGVQCGDLLRQLMDRDLTRIVGRTDDLGRPLLYGTTKRFLQIFGLRHLDELPRAATLRRPKPEPAVPVNEPPLTENETASPPRRFSPGDAVGMIADPKLASRKQVG